MLGNGAASIKRLRWRVEMGLPVMAQAKRLGRGYPARGLRVHVVGIVQVFPLAGAGIIVVLVVIVFVLGLQQMVQNPVDHAADGAGVVADFLQAVEGLLVVRGLVFTVIL
jgi:hypothetical protein